MKRYPYMVAATCGAAALHLLVVAHAQNLGADPRPLTDGAALDFVFAERVPPAPRSLDLADAFTEENVLDLPALGDEDVVDHEANPPMIGRVYDVLASPTQDGKWIELPDGGRLWTLTVRSPNAVALRLEFEPFKPPVGAELIVYNAYDPWEAYGPFGRERSRPGLPYWSPTVFSNEVRVEYYLPAWGEGDGAAGEVKLTGVLQQFPGEDWGAGGRESCRIDVTCDPTWADEARAVAHIHFVSGGQSYICSGAMVNRIPGDFARLFLTAAHCISNEDEANSIEVYWLYQTEDCNDPDPGHGSVPRSDQSTLLAIDIAPDNVLLGLLDDVPGNLWWAGWDPNPIPNGWFGTLIHHPMGVRKSISYGFFEGLDPNEPCANPIETTYRLDLWDGGQEGGSSGAPAFDPNHRIRTVASCSESGCTPDEDTWEGSFPDAYYQLEPFLEAADDVWVDGSYGGLERGTMVMPWNTIIEGYYGVNAGGTIHIRSGAYPPVTLDGFRAMTLTAFGGVVTIGQ